MTAAMALLLGVFGWSLAEYLLHRFLGHDRRTMPNPFSVEHTRHHSEGNYFAPGFKKAGVAVLAAAALLLSSWWLVPHEAAVAFVVGFVGMYVMYEVIHRRAHTHAPVTAFGAMMRRHHFHHHFHDPRSNHGVTSPLWDVVFSTRKPVGVIRVPRALAMPWLVDAQGEIREAYRGQYERR